MECIYLEELNFIDKTYAVPAEEANHLKVLRINTNDKILITNGNGLMALALIERKEKLKFFAKILEYYENFGELSNKNALAIGIITDKNRFEFDIEKCIELGIYEFFPLILDLCSTKTINQSRLILKAISTIKQCKRTKLPTIHTPITLNNLFKKLKEDNVYRRIFITDESGININNIEIKYDSKNENKKNSIVIVGGEGGFSENEKKIFPKECQLINLGNRRLRSETAAIISIGFLSISG